MATKTIRLLLTSWQGFAILSNPKVSLTFDATHNPRKQMIGVQIKWRGTALSVSPRPDPREVQSDAESPKKDWSPSSLT
jgi:hypothetical protein